MLFPDPMSGHSQVSNQRPLEPGRCRKAHFQCQTYICKLLIQSDTMFRGWDGLPFYPKQNKMIVEIFRIEGDSNPNNKYVLSETAL